MFPSELRLAHRLRRELWRFYLWLRGQSLYGSRATGIQRRGVITGIRAIGLDRHTRARFGLRRIMTAHATSQAIGRAPTGALSTTIAGTRTTTAIAVDGASMRITTMKAGDTVTKENTNADTVLNDGSTVPSARSLNRRVRNRHRQADG